ASRFVIESFRSGVRRRGLSSPVAIGDTALSPKAVGSAPSTTGDHARASASKERRQKTANSHPAMAGGQRREDARSDPWRRRGRRQDHGAEASAGNAVGGDGRLFQEMRREARLRAERAQGLRVRRRQAEGVRGLRQQLVQNAANLSKLEIEMIATVVSSQNRCFYCITAHG